VRLRRRDHAAQCGCGRAGECRHTLLYRIAQTATLRTYVNVPQAYADAVRPGQPAVLTVPNLPGRQFTGTVARTANALDPASRTLLVEVQVPNAEECTAAGYVRRG